MSNANDDHQEVRYGTVIARAIFVCTFNIQLLVCLKINI